MLTTVRRVLPHEYPKYRTHLKQLDAESKVLRFGFPTNDSVIDTLCDKFEATPDKHILFAIEDANLNFIAVGHIALEGEMELAFSVLKEYQGQGMGNKLMKRCIQWCRTKGILEGCMVCLSTNSTIKHLCKKYGISMTSEHGETLATIKFGQADVTTYVSEVTDSNLAVIGYLGKRVLNPLALVT